MSPRVVIAAPVFNKAAYLREAVESLLAQTFEDFALVLIDDRSDDETVAVARSFAARDPRVHVEVNPSRLGMLANTNRAFALGRERFPQAEFWALGSDHDVWHDRWLQALVAALDERPPAVLAYPQTRRIDEQGRQYPRAKPPWRFETRGIGDPRERMRTAFRGMVAGEMVYGLFRASALRKVGAYRPVLIPDRLLLTELALHGEFLQVPEVLWERRFRGLADLDRQRRLFFLDAVPAYAHAPWWLTHAALFGWEYAVRGKGAELGIGRGAGARLALDYVDVSVRHRAWRRGRRARRRVVRARDAALGPPVRAALARPAVRRAVRHHVIPALIEVEDALERLGGVGSSRR